MLPAWFHREVDLRVSLLLSLLTHTPVLLLSGLQRRSQGLTEVNCTSSGQERKGIEQDYLIPESIQVVFPVFKDFTFSPQVSV